MSQEFTFDELYPLNHSNWEQSVNLKSHKSFDFTMSDTSKNYFDQQNLTQQPDEQQNAQDSNKKAERKLKNKINVKNFRQRKKTQQDKIQKKLKFLEAQNKLLKIDKYCRNCKRPYGGFIQVTELQKEENQRKPSQNQFQKYQRQGKESFQFQKPIFNSKNQKQENNRNGKIWIALGILMMVIGIHLYGLNGKDGYQDISISKINSQKWVQIYKNKGSNIDDYLNVKVKVKAKDNPKQLLKNKGIFKQIKIMEQEQNQHRQKQYSQIARTTMQKLDMIEEQTQSGKSQLSDETEVKFHKQLLYAIQAEIDDLGNYL